MSETSKDPKMTVLKCEQCGARLEPDPDNEYATCPYCKYKTKLNHTIEQNIVNNINIHIETNDPEKKGDWLPIRKPDPDRLNEIMRTFIRAALSAAVIVAIGLLFKACGAMIGALHQGGQKESEKPAEEEEAGQAPAQAEAEETEETSPPVEPEGRVIEVPHIASDTLEIDPITQEESSQPNAQFKEYPVSFTQQGQETAFDVTIPNQGDSCLILDEMRNDMRVNVRVYDEKGNELAGLVPGSRNNNGKKIVTSGPNEKITIRAEQYDGLGDFIIRIGMPKPVKDLGNITVLSDYIDYSFQTNVYTLTPEETGLYSFFVTEMMADMRISMEVYDRLGVKITSYTPARNGKGMTSNLKAGETYTIKIGQYEGIGSYKLLIGRQKKTVDLENYTHVKDSIEFIAQRNCYTFTARADGACRFDMTDVNTHNRIMLEVYDRLDNKMGSLDTYYRSGNGRTVTGFKAGETYRIYVYQYEEFGTYLLSLYQPKDVVEITEGDIVKDSVEFAGQVNTYSFTASRDGEATFSISELSGERRVGVSVYNDLDEKLYSESYYENGDHFTITNLKTGAHFKIFITEENGLSDYTLTVK